MGYALTSPRRAGTIGVNSFSPETRRFNSLSLELGSGIGLRRCRQQPPDPLLSDGGVGYTREAAEMARIDAETESRISSRSTIPTRCPPNPLQRGGYPSCWRRHRAHIRVRRGDNHANNIAQEGASLLTEDAPTSGRSGRDVIETLKDWGVLRDCVSVQ